MHYFFFSDDLLEDSDSEEHSRSESVTGRLYLTCYMCSSLEVKGEILLPDFLKNPVKTDDIIFTGLEKRKRICHGKGFFNGFTIERNTSI